MRRAQALLLMALAALLVGCGSDQISANDAAAAQKERDDLAKKMGQKDGM